MAKVRYMHYTKDNGETSERKVVVASSPKLNYLTYDVSKLDQKELDLFLGVLNQIDEFRDNALKDFELLTGITVNSLWRSFKPEGVEWNRENEI